MGKQIDWTQPLSAEDAAWAEQFPSLHSGALEANRAQFPAESEASLEGEDDDEVPPYAEWSKQDLLAETKRRNTEEHKALKVTGTLADLAEQLEKDDEAEAAKTA